YLGRAPRPRPRSLPRFGAADRDEGGAGMALLLLQITADRARTLPGARHLHSVDEAQEYSAPPARRRLDYTSRSGILRLRNKEISAEVSRDGRAGFIYARPTL